MNTKSLLMVVTAGTLCLGIVGCKKEDVQKAEDSTKQAAGNAVDAVKSGTEAVVDKTKDVAAEAADKAKEGAAAVKTETEKLIAPASAPDQMQAIIDNAKSLVAAGKYQDALTSLQGLSGTALSDAQQKMVDDLKAQIQKVIADKTAAQGAGAVGNLLGK